MSLIKKEISGLEWLNVLQRITVLEEKVLGKVKRQRGTEAQRFLLLYHLGLLNPILELESPRNQKDQLVSLLLDIDPNNAKKFISELSKKDKPLLQTEANYTFLSSIFEKTGDKKRFAEVETIFTSIRTKKEKQK